jgi:hypothetical protein
MTSKITLYSEKELIKEMKVYAKEQNTSVSKIVNEFFKNILYKERDVVQKTSITDSLIGAIKIKTSEDEYKQHLEDKYL